MPYPSDRRERALMLAAEGRIGGRQAAKASTAARRERSQRLSDHLQEAASRHAELIEKALVDALRKGTPAQRLRAAEAFSRLALAAESQTASQERHESEHLDRAQLIDRLAVSLTQGPAAGLVSAEVERRNGAVDGHAVELPAD